MSRLIDALTHIIAPRVCRVCGCSLTASEDIMCLACDLDMPRLSIHNSDFNTIHRRLGHQCKVDRAAGWFEYRKGSAYARLLIDAKYADMPQLARRLGRRCASELKSDGFFDGIEVVTPMPMHWWKKMKRGYNQATEICLGISEATGVTVADALHARRHGVQSRHNLQQRYDAIHDTMSAPDPTPYRGKHVLIVDDIITSGASVAEAVRALATASPSAVSVLALGLTQLDS